jgi:molecular chaperone HscB
MRDAFDVLGLEPRFDIDDTELDRVVRQLLAELHPNRSRNAESQSDDGVLFAKQGEINQAYSQLRDPATRAELLMVRRNASLASQQSPLLLSRIFQQREAIEQALTRRDSVALSDCVGAARARQVELVSVLAEYFSAQTPQSAPQTTNLALVLQELKYLDKMVKRGQQALDDFE